MSLLFIIRSFFEFGRRGPKALKRRQPFWLPMYVIMHFMTQLYTIKMGFATRWLLLVAARLSATDNRQALAAFFAYDTIIS